MLGRACNLTFTRCSNSCVNTSLERCCTRFNTSSKHCSNVLTPSSNAVQTLLRLRSGAVEGTGSTALRLTCQAAPPCQAGAKLTIPRERSILVDVKTAQDHYPTLKRARVLFSERSQFLCCWTCLSGGDPGRVPERLSGPWNALRCVPMVLECAKTTH